MVIGALNVDVNQQIPSLVAEYVIENIPKFYAQAVAEIYEVLRKRDSEHEDFIPH